MAEETKTVSIRLPQDAIDYLADKGESVTKQIMRVIIEHKALMEHKNMISTDPAPITFYDITNFMNRVHASRQQAFDELRGVFTPDEWQWIAASLNGILLTDEIRFNKDVFIWHCEDYKKYNPGESGQWPDVTPEGIAEKVKPLSGLHISAIYDRVDDFWHHCTIDIAEWSKF